MTLSTTDAKIVYTGNGTTGPFSFTFKIFASTDLVVEKYTIADGTITTMVVTTDYTVSGTFPGTGSITLVSSLSSSYKLIIRRSVPYTQTTDLQENDDLPADTIETMNDRGVALVQQVKEVTDRAVVLDSTNTEGITLPPLTGNGLKYVSVNSAEDGFEYSTPTTTTTSYDGTISAGLDASKPASPSVKDIYIATDTFRVYHCFSGGTWTTKLDYSNTVTFTGAALNFAKGSDIASATTTDIGAATGNFVDITGTTTITGLGTVQAGTHRWLKFSGVLTLTHNASSMILPGAANITTAAGDTALFVSLGSGNWRCLFYSKASGYPVISTGGGVLGSYKNLSVTRGSVTQVTVTADELVLEDTSNNKVTVRSVNETAAITSSGANGLDTGSEASNTWYYIWIIRKSSDGTTDSLLSTSSTSPTMPSGYDQKALVSAVHNDGSSNFIDFKQAGKRYNYVVWRTLTSGNIGTGSWVSVTTTNFVPSALSTYCYGSVNDGGSAGACANDNTVAVGTTGAPNKYCPPSNRDTRWEFDIITANTLYAIGDNANYFFRIHGFDINKL